MSLPGPSDLSAINTHREQVMAHNLPVSCGGDCHATCASPPSSLDCPKCELEGAQQAAARDIQRIKDVLWREERERKQQAAKASAAAKKAKAAAAAKRQGAAVAAAAAAAAEPQYEMEVVGHIPQAMVDGILVPARYRVHFIGYGRKEDLWYDVGDPGLADCQEECERFMTVRAWKKCLKLAGGVRKKIYRSRAKLAAEETKLATQVQLLAGLEEELEWHQDEVDRVAF